MRNVYTLKTLWMQFGRLGRLQFEARLAMFCRFFVALPEDTTCVNFVEEENPSRRIEQFMKQRCLDDLIFGYLWCLKNLKDIKQYLKTTEFEPL